MRWTEKFKENWKHGDGWERFEMIFFPLAIIICAFMIVICIVGITVNITRKSNADTTEVYCIVEDKNSCLQKAGQTTLYKHYLYVSMDDTSDGELHKVQVPSRIYQDVEIGNTVKCVIYYDDNGICDIQLWEPGLVEEDDYE